MRIKLSSLPVVPSCLSDQSHMKCVPIKQSLSDADRIPIIPWRMYTFYLGSCIIIYKTNIPWNWEWYGFQGLVAKSPPPSSCNSSTLSPLVLKKVPYINGNRILGANPSGRGRGGGGDSHTFPAYFFLFVDIFIIGLPYFMYLFMRLKTVGAYIFFIPTSLVTPPPPQKKGRKSRWGHNRFQTHKNNK